MQDFIHLYASVGVDFGILKAAEAVNMRCIDRYFAKVREALWILKGKQIAVLELAFKANTDDTRFAPALEVVKRLITDGAHVRACDPEAMGRAKHLFPQVQYNEDPFETLRGADAALIYTEWDIFRALDWVHARKLMAASW